MGKYWDDFVSQSGGQNSQPEYQSNFSTDSYSGGYYYQSNAASSPQQDNNPLYNGGNYEQESQSQQPQWQTQQPQQTQQTFDRTAAKQALDTIARLTDNKQLADMIGKYGTDSAKNDNFLGQTAASFGSGKINELANQAWGRYAQDGSEKSKAEAEAYSLLSNYYQNVNAAALDDENRAGGKVGSWISKDMAQYAPQFIEQTKAGAAPILAGAATGAIAGELLTPIPVLDGILGAIAGGFTGAAGGAIAGTKVGTTIGSGKYSYETMRGAAMQNLSQIPGVSVAQAQAASRDEAIISAGIESLDTAIDLIGTIPGIGNAMKKLEVKALKKGVGAWLGNVAGEYGEEFVQEAISIANQRRAQNGQADSGIVGLLDEVKNVVGEMITGQGEGRENLAQAAEAGRGGGVIGAFMGPIGGAVNNLVTAPLQQKALNAVNSLERDPVKQAVNGEMMNRYNNQSAAQYGQQIFNDNAEEIMTYAHQGSKLYTADGKPVGDVTARTPEGILLTVDGKPETIVLSGNSGLVNPGGSLATYLKDGAYFDDPNFAEDQAVAPETAPIRDQPPVGQQMPTATSPSQPIQQQARPVPQPQPQPQAKAAPQPQQQTQPKQQPAPQPQPQTPQFQNQDVFDNTKYKIDQDSNGKFVVYGVDGKAVGGTYDTYAQAVELAAQMSQRNEQTQQQAAPQEQKAAPNPAPQAEQNTAPVEQPKPDVVKNAVDQHFENNKRSTVYPVPNKKLTIKKNADGTYTVRETRSKKAVALQTFATSDEALRYANEYTRNELTDKPKVATTSKSPQNTPESVSREEGNSVLPNEQNASEVQNEKLNSKPEGMSEREADLLRQLAGRIKNSKDSDLEKVANMSLEDAAKRFPNASRVFLSAQIDLAKKELDRRASEGKVKTETKPQPTPTKAEEKPANPLVEEKTEQPKTEAKVERTGKPITEFKGDYYFLHSTFKGGSPAKYDGKGYTSVQEAFDSIVKEKGITNREEKLALMKELIRSKYTGVNAGRLLKTGDSELISQYDIDGKLDIAKTNEYGKLLMEVRDEIKAEKQHKTQENQKQKDEKPKPAIATEKKEPAKAILTESQKKEKEERDAARKRHNEEIKAEADAVNEFYYGSKKKAKEATAGKKPTSALFKTINEIAKSKGVIRETDENGNYVESFGKYINRIYRAFGLEADIDSEFHFMPSSKNNSAEYTNEEWIDTEGAEETDKITAILDQAYNTANQGNEDDGSMRSPRGSLSDSLSMADMPDHIQANIDARQKRLDEFVDSLRKQQAEGKELSQIQIETRARMIEGIEEQKHRLQLAQQWNKYSAIVDQIQVLQSISKNKAGLPVLLTSNGQVVNPTMEQFWGWIVNQARNSGRTNFEESIFNRALDADVEALLTDAMSKDSKYSGKTAYDLRLTDVLDLDVPNPLFEYDDAQRVKKDQTNKVEIDATDNGKLIELSAAINEIIARGEHGTLGLKPQKGGVKYETEETDPKMMTARQSESKGSLIATYDEVLGSVEDFEEYADTIRNIDDPMVRKVMDAIDYTLEVDEDGVHAYYDWQKLNAILSDPYGAMNGILNSKELTTEVGTNRRVNEEEQKLNYRDSTNHTVSNANVLDLIDAVEFLLPQEGERRVDRNERGDLEINKIYGKVDTRTINQKNSEGMSDAKAKRLANERNSGTVFGDPKRSNSKVTTDLVDERTAYKWYISKVKDGSYWAVRDAKARGVPFNAQEFWEKHVLPSAFRDNKTGRHYFSFRNAINLLADQDTVNIAKQFVEEAQRENPDITKEYDQLTARKQEIEEWLEKFNRKQTNLLSKAANTKQWDADVKQAQKYDEERQQIKERLEEIEFGRESAKNLLERINDYDLKVWQAAEYYPFGRELFGDPKEEGTIASVFGKATVKGLMNAETSENARELVDWLRNKKLEDKTRYEQGEFAGSGRYVEQFGNVEYYTPGNGTPGVTAGNFTGDGRRRNNTGDGESASGQNGIESPVSGTGTGERGGRGGRSGSVYGQSDSGTGRSNERGAGKGVSEGTDSGSTRRLGKFKNREERKADWQTVKGLSERLASKVKSRLMLSKAKTKSKGNVLDALHNKLTQDGIDHDTFPSGIVAVEGRRRAEDVIGEDKRFGQLTKRAAKKNTEIFVFDAITKVTNNSASTPGGTNVLRFENGILKGTVYAHNYDNAMHEIEHSTYANAAFNNFKGERTNANIPKARAAIAPMVDKGLRKSFVEAGYSEMQYEQAKAIVEAAYGKADVVEEMYVELAGRAFNGVRNGTFSTWHIGDVYFDDIAQTLRSRSETFGDLVAAMNSESDAFIKSQAALATDNGAVSTSDYIEDLGSEGYEYEAGQGAYNESSGFMDTQEAGEVYGALNEMSRDQNKVSMGDVIHEETWTDKEGKEHKRQWTGAKGYNAADGQAATRTERHRSYADDMNAPSEVMNDLAQSREDNAQTAKAKTRKDYYGDYQADVINAEKRFDRHSRRSIYTNENRYYAAFGKTSDSQKNFGNLKKLSNNMKLVFEGKMSISSFRDFARGMADKPGVGLVLNEDVRNELERVAALEEKIQGKVPEEKDVHNFQRAASRLAAKIETRMEAASSAEYVKSKLESLAKHHGKAGKQTLTRTAGDWYNRMQISGDNFWRMMGNWNKEAGSVAYELAREHNKAIATKIHTEAKAKNFFSKVDNTKQYRDLAEGKTMSKVDFGGHKISLMQGIRFVKIVDTLLSEDTFNDVPDWQRVAALDGFDLKDADGNHTHVDIEGGFSDKEFYQRIEWVRKKYEDVKAEIKANKAASQYMAACEEMYDELGKDAAAVYERQNGYKLRMYEKGKYTNIYYHNNANPDAEWNFKDSGSWDVDDTGSTYERTKKHGGYAVVDAMSTSVDGYINALSNYIAFEEFSQKLGMLTDKNGINGSLRNTVKAAHGDQYAKWLDNYVKDMSLYRDENSVKTPGQQALAKSRRLMMQGALLGSVSVPIKQVSSFFASMGTIDPRAVLSTWRGPLRTGSKGLEKAGITNYLLKSREQSYSDPDVANALNGGILNWIKKHSKVGSFVINSTNIMDSRTVSNVYRAAIKDIELNILSKQELYKNGKDYKDGLTDMGQFYVDSKFEEALLATQPIFNKQARAEIARTDSELLKMLSTFRTQQTQNYNRMLQAANEWKAGNEKSGKALRQTLEGQVLSAASLGALTCLSDILLHKLRKYKKEDDDKYNVTNQTIDPQKIFNRWALNSVEAAAGTGLFIGDLTKYVYDVLNKNFNDDWSVYSGKEFYGISSGAIGSAIQTINSVAALYEEITENGGKKVAAKAKMAAGNVATMLGIPLNNAYALLNAGVQWFGSIDGAYNGALKPLNGRYGEDIFKEIDHNRTNKGNAIYNALQKGNTDKVNAILEEAEDGQAYSWIYYTGLERVQRGDLDADEFARYLDIYTDTSDAQIEKVVKGLNSGVSQYNGKEGQDRLYNTNVTVMPDKRTYDQMFKSISDRVENENYGNYTYTWDNQTKQAGKTTSAVIEELTRNIKAGNLSKQAAEIIWTQHYLQSVSKNGLWRYIRDA